MTDSSNIDAHEPPEVLSLAPRVHLVGICGSGMKALAEVLLDQGVCLTGSDADPTSETQQTLESQGVRVFAGHRAEYVGPHIERLIYSPAIPADNVEREAACRRGIPQASYPEALAELTRTRRSIAISGTHGKSSTTAILSHLLRETPYGPTVFCGAECINTARNGWLGTGDWAVVEACEYRRHFLGLTPEIAIILGIEPDHFDSYKSLDEAITAYETFARRVSSSGKVIAAVDCPFSDQLRSDFGDQLVTFAIQASAEWSAGHIARTPDGWRFELMHRGAVLGEFELPRPGRHDIHNAVAALACAIEIGVPVDLLAARLATFAGLKRRYERIGIRNGVTYIDDYAHHPTEVAAVLATAQAELRSTLSRKRVWCAFQPHQVLRTRRLFDEFVAALSLADRLLLLPAYTAREADQAAAREVSQQLAGQLTQLGCRTRVVSTLDHLRETMETLTRPGDIFLTLGAGDIGRVHHEFAGRIRGYRAG